MAIFVFYTILPNKCTEFYEIGLYFVVTPILFNLTMFGLHHPLYFISEDKQLSELDLDGLDELEDSEDEAVIEEYRKRRIAELKSLSEKPRFGEVREVSGQGYVQEVNKAGQGIWVVIHLYKQG